MLKEYLLQTLRRRMRNAKNKGQGKDLSLPIPTIRKNPVQKGTNTA
jgi:hypothetical protein